MKHVCINSLIAAFLWLLVGVPALAQTSTNEFLPEVDAYLQLSSNVRIAFQDKETISEGNLVLSDQGRLRGS